MIDINYAKESFANYTKQYDFNNQRINLKYYHSLRVADLAKNIALDLKLSDEDVALAELIGLLHDIGRFEQVKRFDSFDDLKTIDHADFSIELLKEGLIRDFIESNQYDKIIYQSIGYHNKKEIPATLDSKTNLHAKIIRDADKIDILYLGSLGKINYHVDNEMVSSEVEQSIKNKKSVDRIFVKTKSDRIMVTFSFIYDLNFNYSKKYLLEKNYINELFNTVTFDNLEIKEKISQIKEIINNDLKNIKEES